MLDVLQDKVLLKNGTDIHKMLKNTHLLKHRGQDIQKIERKKRGRGAQSDDWAHLANKREMGAPVDALIIPKSEMPSKYTKLKALMARSLKDYSRVEVKTKKFQLMSGLKTTFFRQKNHVYPFNHTFLLHPRHSGPCL